MGRRPTPTVHEGPEPTGSLAAFACPTPDRSHSNRVIPGEFVDPLAPDDLPGAVRQDHDEGVRGLRPPADADAGQLASVGLGLCAWGRIDAAVGPQPGHRVLRAGEPRDGAIRAAEAVFVDQVVVRRQDVGRRRGRTASRCRPAALEPVVDDVGRRVGPARPAASPVGGAGPGTAEVVADGALGVAEAARDLRIRLALAVQRGEPFCAVRYRRS